VEAPLGLSLPRSPQAARMRGCGRRIAPRGIDILWVATLSTTPATLEKLLGAAMFAHGCCSTCIIWCILNVSFRRGW
jgi:hypothetical protein